LRRLRSPFGPSQRERTPFTFTLEHKDGSPAEPNWSPGDTTAIKEDSLKGVRYFLRNFTAVKEHLRFQIEDSGGSPKLTPKEIELVRFVREGSFDWALIAERLPLSIPMATEER
jgi:hypothetical protein